MIGQMLSEATGSYRPKAEVHDQALPDRGVLRRSTYVHVVNGQ
jgi:hypothetical protein